jgi:hypothetical protein
VTPPRSFIRLGVHVALTIRLYKAERLVPIGVTALEGFFAWRIVWKVDSCAGLGTYQFFMGVAQQAEGQGFLHSICCCIDRLSRHRFSSTSTEQQCVS